MRREHQRFREEGTPLWVLAPRRGRGGAGFPLPAAGHCDWQWPQTYKGSVCAGAAAADDGTDGAGRMRGRQR
jgi:hypothetical protein